MKNKHKDLLTEQDTVQVTEQVGHPALALTGRCEPMLIHPFREGNGRLSCLPASVMALQTVGRQPDYTVCDENKADYLAAIQAGMTDYGPLKGFVRRVLREMARNVDG